MSSTYTGDRTATQAPGPPPVSGSPPKATLPADGDPANAASVAQMTKEAMDFAAFAQQPFANGSQWAQKIYAPQDARLRSRWVLDHFGLPRGEFIDWKEDWTPATPFNNAIAGVTAGTLVGRWNAVANSAGSNLSAFPPGQPVAIPPFPSYMSGFVFPSTYRTLGLILDGGAGGNYASLGLRSDSSVVAPSAGTLVRCAAWITPKSVLDVTWRLGLIHVFDAFNAIANGVYFERPDTPGTNWKCVCKSSAGGTTTLDSGVLAAADATHFFEVVIVGSAIADSSLTLALFFIDGVNVGISTTNVPTNVPTGTPVDFEPGPMFGGIASGTVANPVMLVSPLHFQSITTTATP